MKSIYFIFLEFLLKSLKRKPDMEKAGGKNRILFPDVPASQCLAKARRNYYLYWHPGFLFRWDMNLFRCNLYSNLKFSFFLHCFVILYSVRQKALFCSTGFLRFIVLMMWVIVLRTASPLSRWIAYIRLI